MSSLPMKKLNSHTRQLILTCLDIAIVTDKMDALIAAGKGPDLKYRRREVNGVVLCGSKMVVIIVEVIIEIGNS